MLDTPWTAHTLGGLKKVWKKIQLKGPKGRRWKNRKR
jgi:hypothetical protein